MQVTGEIYPSKTAINSILDGKNPEHLVKSYIKEPHVKLAILDIGYVLGKSNHIYYIAEKAVSPSAELSSIEVKFISRRWIFRCEV
jgi:hypothetical protein